MGAGFSEIPQVDLSVRPIYVAGYPIHAALTLRANKGSYSHVELRYLPWMNVYDQANVGVSVTDAQGNTRASKPARYFDRDLELGGGFTLDSDHPARMLIDLSDAWPGDVSPGNYQIAVSYPVPAGIARTSAALVKIRAPTPAEQARLQQVAEPRRRRSGWGGWALMPIENSGLPEGTPLVAGDPLLFLLILRRWSRGADAARALGPALDVLDEFYAPEREALRAERLIALKDPAGPAAAAQVASAHPELFWWAHDLPQAFVSWTGLRLR
ncbi:MAG: hypothetical protein U0359_35070 [Byssovorax sp.]